MSNLPNKIILSLILMTTSQKALSSSTNSILGPLFSLILPGLGQFLLKKRERGLLILAISAILAFLIYWSLKTQNIGKVDFGGITTSWLWIPFLLFRVWNVFDAQALRLNRLT